MLQWVVPSVIYATTPTTEEVTLKGRNAINNMDPQFGFSACVIYSGCSLQGKRERRTFDCGDPPFSDRGRTDHRQLEMAENTWESIKLFMSQRERQ